MGIELKKGFDAAFVVAFVVRSERCDQLFWVTMFTKKTQ